jgi:hypothetical protein
MFSTKWFSTKWWHFWQSNKSWLSTKWSHFWRRDFRRSNHTVNKVIKLEFWRSAIRRSDPPISTSRQKKRRKRNLSPLLLFRLILRNLHIYLWNYLMCAYVYECEAKREGSFDWITFFRNGLVVLSNHFSINFLVVLLNIALTVLWTLFRISNVTFFWILG